MNKGIAMGALLAAGLVAWQGGLMAAPKSAPKPVVCYEGQRLAGKALFACTEGDKPFLLRRWTEVELPRSPDDDPEGRYTRKAVIGWR